MKRPKIKINTTREAGLLGFCIGIVVALIVFLLVFFAYRSGTEELNNNQRFRAICEDQGGHTVYDGDQRYCIKGNEILLIDLDK